MKCKCKPITIAGFLLSNHDDTCPNATDTPTLVGYVETRE